MITIVLDCRGEDAERDPSHLLFRDPNESQCLHRWRVSPSIGAEDLRVMVRTVHRIISRAHDAWQLVVVHDSSPPQQGDGAREITAVSPREPAFVALSGQLVRVLDELGKSFPHKPQAPAYCWFVRLDDGVAAGADPTSRALSAAECPATVLLKTVERLGSKVGWTLWLRVTAGAYPRARAELDLTLAIVGIAYDPGLGASLRQQLNAANQGSGVAETLLDVEPTLDTFVHQLRRFDRRLLEQAKGLQVGREGELLGKVMIAERREPSERGREVTQELKLAPPLFGPYGRRNYKTTWNQWEESALDHVSDLRNRFDQDFEKAGTSLRRRQSTQLPLSEEVPLQEELKRREAAFRSAVDSLRDHTEVPDPVDVLRAQLSRRWRELRAQLAARPSRSRLLYAAMVVVACAALPGVIVLSASSASLLVGVPTQLLLLAQVAVAFAGLVVPVLVARQRIRALANGAGTDVQEARAELQKGRQAKLLRLGTLASVRAAQRDVRLAELALRIEQERRLAGSYHLKHIQMTRESVRRLLQSLSLRVQAPEDEAERELLPTVELDLKRPASAQPFYSPFSAVNHSHQYARLLGTAHEERHAVADVPLRSLTFTRCGAAPG